MKSSNNHGSSSGLEYEEWHARLDVDERTEAPWHQLVKQHLSDEDLLDKDILEIGCGRGGFACWLAVQPMRPKQIVAADFAQTAVEKGRAFAEQRGISGITWKRDDIQAISASDNTFDTVISCETIEHVPEPRRALQELARVLKPGGRLFLTCPNYFGTLGVYRGYLRLTGRRFTEEGQPINNFLLLPRTIVWVNQAGLRVGRVDAVGHYLPFPGRPPIRTVFFDRVRAVSRWFALHSMILAQKP